MVRTKQDRKPKAIAAREFQTALVGIMGHDLRQSLHVIQGTYALLRSGREDMRHQAWLDRGERAVTKLTENLNCLVDAFYLAERTDELEVSSVALGPLFGGCCTKVKMPLFKEASIFERLQRTPPM
jgi:signal transduction histidine kinase